MKIDLKKILAQFPEAQNSRQQLQGLLRDLYPAEKRDINLLLNVWDCGAAAEIRGMKRMDNVQMSRMIRRLDNEYGISEKFAREALSAWAEAYGVSVCVDAYASGDDGVKEKMTQRVQTPPTQQRNKPSFRTAQVGDVIRFGSYLQDNYAAGEKEPIEWQVISRENSRILVISRYGLDCAPFDTSGNAVTWETCELRRWLNDTFLNFAFTAEEQARIPTVTVTADVEFVKSDPNSPFANPAFAVNQGKNTRDKVFLLSEVEAAKFFGNDEARKCAPTAFARAQGAVSAYEQERAKGAYCSWTLRTKGSASITAIPWFGSVGHTVTSITDARCIRPALWIETA